MRDNGTDTGDAAALAGGAIAASLTVFSQRGAFDAMDGIVGLTLLLVVSCYIGGHSRPREQSLAFSATIALLTIPIVGCIFDQIADAEAYDGWWQVGHWLIVCAVTFWGDCQFQRRLIQGVGKV